MLAVDAFFGILTSLPINIFPIFQMVAVLEKRYKPFGKEVITYMKILYGIALINCFVSPIFYYIFNQAMQVSGKNATCTK